MNTFQNNFAPAVVLKQKKRTKTLTTIITFELSYFNCDHQIAMRDKEAGWEIDYEPPPIPLLKQ